MLPKKYRLPLRTELKRVKATGKLVHGKLFSLLVASQIPNSKFQIPNSRFAFIISSKVDKRATKRNRAKRLLSEAIYSLKNQIRPGFEVVFLVKKTIVDRQFKEIQEEVKKVFNQVGLI